MQFYIPHNTLLYFYYLNTFVNPINGCCSCLANLRFIAIANYMLREELFSVLKRLQYSSLNIPFFFVGGGGRRKRIEFFLFTFVVPFIISHVFAIDPYFSFSLFGGQFHFHLASFPTT